MERLASAILIQTLKDWEKGQGKSEIQAFLESKWFQNLAEMAGMNPQDIRAKILSGAYHRVDLRAAYR